MSLAWRSSDGRVRVPALQVSLSLTWSSVTGSGSGIQLGLVSEFKGASNDRRGVARGELQVALRFHVSTE